LWIVWIKKEKKSNSKNIFFQPRELTYRNKSINYCLLFEIMTKRTDVCCQMKGIAINVNKDVKHLNVRKPISVPWNGQNLICSTIELLNMIKTQTRIVYD